MEIHISIDFLQGLVIGLLCALTGALTTAVYFLYRSYPTNPPDEGGWDVPDFPPPPEWSEVLDLPIERV